MKPRSTFNHDAWLSLTASAIFCGGCTQAWRENTKKPTLVFRPVTRAAATRAAKRFLAVYARESPLPYRILSLICHPDRGDWTITFFTGFVDDFVSVEVEEKTGRARISKSGGYVLHGPQNELDPAPYLSLSDFQQALSVKDAKVKGHRRP